MKALPAMALGALLLAGTAARAAGDCTTLCDGTFYPTATVETVQQLIQNGADVNGRDSAGKTPLHWAGGADPAVIVALLQAGADVNAVDSLNRAPIHFVTATGSAESITILLNAGADVNARTANDWTPLHGVAKFGAPENVALLIDAGADAGARNEMGESPFDLAKTNQRMAGTEAFEMLKAAH